MTFSGDGTVVIPIRGDSSGLQGEILQVSELTAKTARRLASEYDISIGQAAKLIRQKRQEIQAAIQSTTENAGRLAGLEYGQQFVASAAESIRKSRQEVGNALGRVPAVGTDSQIQERSRTQGSEGLKIDLDLLRAQSELSQTLATLEEQRLSSQIRAAKASGDEAEAARLTNSLAGLKAEAVERSYTLKRRENAITQEIEKIEQRRSISEAQRALQLAKSANAGEEELRQARRLVSLEEERLRNLQRIHAIQNQVVEAQREGARAAAATPAPPAPTPGGGGRGGALGGLLNPVAVGNLQAQAAQAAIQGLNDARRAIGNTIADSLGQVRELDEQVTTFAAKSQASAEQAAALEAEAKRLGATTTRTAVEVAALGADLAALGFGAEGSKNVLEGIVLAQQATGEELGEVGTTVAGTINTFSVYNKTQEDSVRVADIFTAAVNNSALTISKLNQGIATSGGVANSFNQSLETTTAVLGVLADANIRAESAATAYKNILISLAAPNEKATEALKQLQEATGQPLRLRDEATGQLLALEEILPQLQAGFNNLDPSKAEEVAVNLVGREALAGFTTLLGNMDSFNRQLDIAFNSSGSAESTAEKRLESIGSRIELLKSALSGIQINFGQALEPSFSAILGFVTDIASKLANTEGIFSGLVRGGEALTKLFDEQADLADMIADAIAGGLTDAFNNVGSIVENVSDTLRENPGIIKAWLQETGRTLQVFTDLASIVVEIADIIGDTIGLVAKLGSIKIPLLDQLSDNVPVVNNLLGGQEDVTVGSAFSNLNPFALGRRGLNAVGSFLRGGDESGEQDLGQANEQLSAARGRMAETANETQAAADAAGELAEGMEEAAAATPSLNEGLEETFKSLESKTQDAINASSLSQTERLAEIAQAQLNGAATAEEAANQRAEAEIDATQQVLEARREELQEIQALEAQGSSLSEEQLNRKAELQQAVAQDALSLLEQEIELQRQLNEQRINAEFQPQLDQNNASISAATNELSLLQARSALASELSSIEEQRLQHQIAIAETSGNEAQAARLTLQLDQLKLRNIASTFQAKRQELAIEQQLTQLRARSAVLESQRDLQLAQANGASAEQLSTLQGIVSARQQELGLLDEQFRLQNQLLDAEERRQREGVQQNAELRDAREDAAARSEAERQTAEEEARSGEARPGTTSSSQSFGFASPSGSVRARSFGDDVFSQLTSNIDNPIINRIAQDDLRNNSSVVSSADYYGQGSSGGLAAQQSELQTDLLRNAVNDFQGLAANAERTGTALSQSTIDRFEQNLERIAETTSRPAIDIVGSKGSGTGEDAESVLGSFFGNGANDLLGGGSGGGGSVSSGGGSGGSEPESSSEPSSGTSNSLVEITQSIESTVSQILQAIAGGGADAITGGNGSQPQDLGLDSKIGAQLGQQPAQAAQGRIDASKGLADSITASNQSLGTAISGLARAVERFPVIGQVNPAAPQVTVNANTQASAAQIGTTVAGAISSAATAAARK